MKVILVGNSEMLRSLALGIIGSRHEIVGILRQERIRRNFFERLFFDYLKPSQDYIFIKTHNLNEIKVKSVNSEKFRRIIKELNADVVVVGSFGEKFSAQTLNVIPNGFVNVHPSLLPKYRGPNPYIQVILNNELTTGITFHLMDVNYDTGPILLQKEINILPNDTGASLRMKCCNVAKNEIPFLLNNLKDRIIHQRSQNENDSTYQPQISLKETIIDFNKRTSFDISKQIRAFFPWLKCYIAINNNFYSFKSHKIINKKITKEPGTVVNKTENSISIVCKDFIVMEFTDLQLIHPLSKFVSKFFWDKIKINDIAK